MSGAWERRQQADASSATGAPAAELDEDVSLISGEALDDDALDELCDATLAAIGDA